MSGKAILLTLLGVALAAGAPFVLVGPDFLQPLRAVAPALVLNLAALALLSGVAKAGKLQVLQWRLGARPPFARTLAISLASDFAFLTSPAGVGGYVVNIALLRRTGVPWSTATSVVAAEQALDLAFFALCIPLCLLYVSGLLMRIAAGVPVLTWAVIGGCLLVAALLWLLRKRIFRFVGAGGSGPWRRVVDFLSELRAQLVDIVRGEPRENAELMLLTAVQWLARYGALWLVLDAMGHRLPLSFVVVVQAVILHLAQWTAIPGGGGSADLALAAVLSRWLPSPATAVVLPLWRFATFYIPLLLGTLSFAALARHTLKRA